MKKILFLLMLVCACWQVNAADYSNANYIEQWGDLKLVGNQLCDQNGNAIQLKGWSTFGLQWTTQCYGENAWQAMKEFGANVVRFAMYVDDEGSYFRDPSTWILKMKNYVDQAANVGLYCVVDYHVLPTNNNGNKQNPEDYFGSGTYTAAYFFEQITSYVKSKNYKHVIYEICNEPGNCSWSNICSYADKVLPTIQSGDPGAIVIVGTPQWDQLIDYAVSSPITKYPNLNLMYAFHYYSCSHQNFLPKLKTAAGSIPVFVSEWGAVNFDGNNTKNSSAAGDYAICTGSGDQLLATCDGDNNGKVKISWCFWNWGDKDEASSSIIGCGTYTESNLTNSGKYILTKLCGDGDCKTTVKTGGAYAKQSIPTTATEIYFDLAYYDLGGEGVAYHDGNGTDYEQNENEGNCNNGYQYGGDDFNFRPGECVDVSNCYNEKGTYDTHNLNTRENDEWLKYTVVVKEPGYYNFKYLANPGTSGTIAFTVGDADGSNNFGNALYNTSTMKEMTTAKLLAYDKGDQTAESWKFWMWKYPNTGKGTSQSEDVCVLFKEAGTFVLTISFPTEGGDLGPFVWTKKMAYNGDGYERDKSNVEETNADAQNIAIYPNPAEDVLNINTEVESVEVLNLLGAVVATSNTNAVSVADLAKGSYIVKIVTANGQSVVKQFVKK